MQVTLQHISFRSNKSKWEYVFIIYYFFRMCFVSDIHLFHVIVFIFNFKTLVSLEFTLWVGLYSIDINSIQTCTANQLTSVVT